MAAGGDATLTAQGDRIVVDATGVDPQVVLPPLNVTGRVAIRISVEAPADTPLELYYQTQEAQEFAASRVVNAPLRKGSNNLVITLNEPMFNGALRLDPGQVPGTYTLTAVDVFATSPISVVRAPRSQEELAVVFERAGQPLFNGTTLEELQRLEPLPGVTFRTDGAFTAVASNADPGLLLPEVDAGGAPVIVRLRMSSPAATTVQLFYLKPGQVDYTEAQLVSHELEAGENTVYLDLREVGWTGRLRLDPGMVAGDYGIQSLEIRSASP
jgi:hypothetical protein